MMKQPVHPGSIIKHECMEAVGLSVTAAAEALGVSRAALSRVINGRAGVSPEMAIRLSKAFGSTAEVWLKLQLAYDLAKVKQRAKSIAVKRFTPLSATGEP